jgi:hypothetical protein
VREDEDLQLQIYCGGSPPFSGLIQVDAAAEVDEDEVLCGGGGGGARAAAESREEEDDGRGRMKKDLVVPIYKEGPTVTARETRRPHISIQRPRRLDSRNGH